MLFMNISRRFGTVYQEEASPEAGSPTPAAPVGDAPAAPEKAPAVTPAEVPSAGPEAPQDNGMGQYIEQHSAANPALSLALGFLRDAGIAPTDPAFTLAEVDGDFTLLKAMLAQKGLPGTDAMVAILEKAVSDSKAEVDAHEAATAEMVGQVLGEQQDEILEWARGTASEEEKAAFNDMLAAGGVYARAAAVLLKGAYADSGNTIPAANPVEFSAPSNSNAAGPLDARSFAAEVQALAVKFGGDPRNSREYQVLTQRRAQGRKRGL